MVGTSSSFYLGSKDIQILSGNLKFSILLIHMIGRMNGLYCKHMSINSRGYLFQCYKGLVRHAAQFLRVQILAVLRGFCRLFLLLHRHHHHLSGNLLRTAVLRLSLLHRHQLRFCQILVARPAGPPTFSLHLRISHCLILRRGEC